MTAEEILELIAMKINQIYRSRRPLMIGGNPFGVDMNLFVLHELFAKITEQEQQFHKVWNLERDRVKANVQWFADTFASQDSSASQEEIVSRTIECWKHISNELNLEQYHRGGV